MRRIILTLLLAATLTPASFAGEKSPLFHLNIGRSDSKEIKHLLTSQVKYANKTDFNKFIATYDKSYVNSDGFDLSTYSELVKDTWKTFNNIEYGIKIKNIEIENDTAVAELEETSYAYIPMSKKLDGVLRSKADSVYYLKKKDGKWVVTSDSVISETTSMMYGDARFLDVKLSAPNQISASTEYTATLEFDPPDDTIAIASIAMDKVEYPQKQTKEVFRRLPDDNILERLFISNSDNVNEYIVASIGLTKADIQDLSIKLSLTGFGYQITRVNVVPKNKFIVNEGIKQDENVELE